MSSSSASRPSPDLPSDLPPEIASYLTTLTHPDRSLAYIQVTLQGDIISSGGELATYGLTSANVGDSISKQLFYLDGFFPHPAQHEVLPSIQTKPTQTIDIHFIPVDAHLSDDRDSRVAIGTPQTVDRLWVLLIDSSLETQKQQEIQQRANDLSLLQQTHDPPKNKQILNNISSIKTSLVKTSLAHSHQLMESPLLEQIFAALEILALELTASNQLKPIAQVPNWVKQEFDQLPFGETLSKEDVFKAELFSSFLSNFLIDAADLAKLVYQLTLRQGY